MSKILGITWSWRFSEECGEEYESATIGFGVTGRKCVEIQEHRSAGEGDKWFYDVIYEDNTYDRIFQPHIVRGQL